MIPRLIFGSMMLLVAMTCDAMSAPKRVLLLHSFGRDFAPWNEHARTFREELVRQSPDAIDLFEASLATARSADAEEGPFVEYLRGLFAKRKLDLVVAIGETLIHEIGHYFGLSEEEIEEIEEKYWRGDDV